MNYKLQCGCNYVQKYDILIYAYISYPVIVYFLQAQTCKPSLGGQNTAWNLTLTQLANNVQTTTKKP